MINTKFFLDSLPIMGYGMLGVFIVTAVIITCVALLNKFSPEDK